MAKSDQDQQIDGLLQTAFEDAEEALQVATALKAAVAELKTGSATLTQKDLLTVRDMAKTSLKGSHDALHQAAQIARERDPNARPALTSGTIVVGGRGPSSC